MSFAYTKTSTSLLFELQLAKKNLFFTLEERIFIHLEKMFGYSIKCVKKGLMRCFWGNTAFFFTKWLNRSFFCTTDGNRKFHASKARSFAFHFGSHWLLCTLFVCLCKFIQWKVERNKKSQQIVQNTWKW